MAREKEIKIKLTGLSLGEFISKIKTHGFILQKKISQQDTYFDTSDWFLYHHLSALRLRKVDGLDHSFSFKKVFATPTKRDYFHIEEIEVKAPFANVSGLDQIFSHLSLNYGHCMFASSSELTNYLLSEKYQSEQCMSKTRQIFTKGQVEIVIDDVDRVGVIIELECQDNEPLDVVRSFLTDTQWTRDLEGTSFAWLKSVKGFTSHIEDLKRFKLEPDWNVLPHERQMYQELLRSNL
jgi:adenylate cyclase class IV